MNYLGYAIAGAGGGGSIDLTAVKSNIDPDVTDVYDIGRPTKRWRTGEFVTLECDNMYATNGYLDLVVCDTVNATTVNADIGSIAQVTCATIASNDQVVSVIAPQGLTANKYSVTGANKTQYLMGDGSLLNASANAGNSNFYQYKYLVSSTGVGLASGKIALNNSVPGNVTRIFVSPTTSDGVGVSIYWPFITTLNDVYIQAISDPTNFLRYNVTSLPGISGTSLSLDVFLLDSDGAGFATDAQLMVAFFTNLSETDKRITDVEEKTVNMEVQLGTPNRTIFSGIVEPTSLGGVQLGSTSNRWSILASDVNASTSLNAPTMDSASTLDFGTNTQTALTIGRVGATTNIRGTSIIATGNLIPSGTVNIGTVNQLMSGVFASTVRAQSFDVPSLSANMPIGTGNAGSITIGKITIPTTINSSVLTLTGTITGNLIPTVIAASALGSSSFPWNTVFMNNITMYGNYTMGNGVVVGNWIPTNSNLNLGSATNRWNVFAQTLNLVNTAGVNVTNFNNANTVTISNTTTPTSLLGSGVGSLTLSEVTGSKRRVYCSGIITCLAGATLNINFSGSGTTVFDNTYTLLVSSNAPYIFELEYTNSFSAFTTFTGMGRFSYGTNQPILFRYINNTATGTFTYDLKATWGLASSSNVITASNATVQTLA